MRRRKTVTKGETVKKVETEKDRNIKRAEVPNKPVVEKEPKVTAKELNKKASQVPHKPVIEKEPKISAKEANRERW